jgi:putative aldouronate transport system substrate-binding protein
VKKSMRSIGLVLAMLIVLTTVMAGCTKKAPATTKVGTSKAVSLSMYLLGTPAKDYDAVLAAFNAKAKKDLNCSIGVTWIGWGDYTTKYPLVLASGEPIDLIYTSNWLNFSVEASKGAFLPLEKLAPTYAPKSYAAQTPGMIQTCTVNGHLDALSPKFSQYAMMGYIVRGDLMKKYGIANGSIKTMDDIGAFCADVVKNDKGIDPTGFDSQTSMNIYEPGLLNYYNVTGIYDFPLMVTVDSKGMPTSTVKNIYEDPSYPAFFAKMKQWSDAGYWPKNVLSNKDTAMLTEGTAAMRLHNVDSWTTAYIQQPSWDLQFIPGAPYAYLTSAVQDAMAIPASSKNPERALMLLEKIRTDETYYDLLTYGQKNIDWTLNSKNEVVEKDPNTFAADGYCSWGFKDPEFEKDAAGSPPDMHAIKDANKANGVATPYVNFAFNTDPVKAQVAAIANVMTQYCNPLALGYISDPVAGLATLKQKLNDAGIAAVQTELQKQLDAFNKTVK